MHEMYILSILVIINVYGSIVVGADFEDIDDLHHDVSSAQSTVILEHSFDQGPNPIFSKRGTITIQSLKNGAAHYMPEGPLSDEDRDQLKLISKADGFYRIRVSTRAGAQQSYISTFIKACLLYEASLDDFITINVDLAGNLLGLTIQTDVPYCAGAEVLDDDLSFHTHIHVAQTAPGPIPETQLYIQKIEQEKADKAKGAQADNRGFFGKYWMYIVPLVIFMMFASNSDSGGGGK